MYFMEYCSVLKKLKQENSTHKKGGKTKIGHINRINKSIENLKCGPTVKFCIWVSMECLRLACGVATEGACHITSIKRGASPGETAGV